MGCTWSGVDTDTIPTTTPTPHINMHMHIARIAQSCHVILYHHVIRVSGSRTDHKLFWWQGVSDEPAVAASSCSLSVCTWCLSCAALFIPFHSIPCILLCVGSLRFACPPPADLIDFSIQLVLLLLVLRYKLHSYLVRKQHPMQLNNYTDGIATVVRSATQKTTENRQENIQCGSGVGCFRC